MSHVSERELQPGQVIADRYRLEAPIGRGAMGAVWRAVHVRLESPVAIKFLNASIAGDPDMLERFMREARSAAAVRSSHVVQIFDYGVDGSIPYIAMELLVGEPLDERLAARGSLAAPELDKVFGEVARAVGVAHELGVVHRDIKPANIFIAREGGHEVTKVLDFGIAKLIDRRLDAPVGGGTHTGIILGTPNYMSPEQARGHRKVDHRADLWSLAVLAFECLTGRQPFESSSIGDLVVKICTAEPLVPSEVAPLPAAFDAWFLRGVDKDPEARFRSANEMAEALHAMLAAEGIGAESRPRSTPARLEPSRLDIVQPGAARDGARPDGASAGELTQPSLTTQAVASEVLVSGAAPARHRKLAWFAVPLVAIGVALAMNRTRATHAPATPVAVAPTSGAPVAALATDRPAALAAAADAPRAPSGASNVTVSPKVTSAPAAPAPAAPSSAAPSPAAPSSMAPPSSPDPTVTSAASATTPTATPRTNRRSAARTPRVAGPAHGPRKSVSHEPLPPEPPTSSVPPSAVDPFADRL